VFDIYVVSRIFLGEGTMRYWFPNLLDFMAEFPSCKTTKDDLRLKYVPTKISDPNLPLEQMRNLRTSDFGIVIPSSFTKSLRGREMQTGSGRCNWERKRVNV